MNLAWMHETLEKKLNYFVPRPENVCQNTKREGTHQYILTYFSKFRLDLINKNKSVRPDLVLIFIKQNS